MEGVEIDHCPSCRGTWLDSGELAMITEIAGVEPGELSEAVQGAQEQGKTGRRCPRCRKKLRIIMIGKDRSIEVDRCPRGHGLWLDNGEMLAVIRSYAEGEEGTVARFFSDLYRTELESDQGE
jgi:Zn-finger nucleic acid-binding protein